MSVASKPAIPALHWTPNLPNITVSEGGQYVSIEYDAEGHCVSHPTVHKSHQEFTATIHKASRINNIHEEAIRN